MTRSNPLSCDPTSRGRFWVLLFLLAAACWLPNRGQAHDVGLSSLQVEPDGEFLHVRLTFARPDGEALFPTGRPVLGVNGVQSAELIAVASRLLELRAEGKLLSPLTATILPEPGNGVCLDIHYPAVAGPMLVRATSLQELPRGHRQHAAVRDESGNLLGQQLLDISQPSFEMNLPARTRPSGENSVARFFSLGIEHILTGYDHLLFLLGLLILGAGLKPTLKIVTAFTIAHSVTLVLVALQLVRIPSSVVEPLIAASIIYIGVENVVRPEVKGRWKIAFAFGLIHGCGFGSALGDLGIGSGTMGVAGPLLLFNLGVEVGQLGIAALVLPIIWALRRVNWYRPRYVQACSALIVAAGVFWLVQRLG